MATAAALSAAAAEETFADPLSILLADLTAAAAGDSATDTAGILARVPAAVIAPAAGAHAAGVAAMFRRLTELMAERGSVVQPTTGLAVVDAVTIPLLKALHATVRGGESIAAGWPSRRHSTAV